jgi:hypothetical protein
MSALAELMRPDAELKVPEIETYRGFERLPSTNRSRVAYQLLLEVGFGGRRRPLTKPVRLKLVSEEGRWFAENEALNLFGIGDSPVEAVQDFRQHFEHFLNYYRSIGWSDVTGDGLRLKNLYEELLHPDAA